MPDNSQALKGKEVMSNDVKRYIARLLREDLLDRRIELDKAKELSLTPEFLKDYEQDLAFGLRAQAEFEELSRGTR